MGAPTAHSSGGCSRACLGDAAERLCGCSIRFVCAFPLVPAQSPEGMPDLSATVLVTAAADPTAHQVRSSFREAGQDAPRRPR